MAKTLTIKAAKFGRLQEAGHAVYADPPALGESAGEHVFKAVHGKLGPHGRDSLAGCRAWAIAAIAEDEAFDGYELTELHTFADKLGENPAGGVGTGESQ